MDTLLLPEAKDLAETIRPHVGPVLAGHLPHMGVRSLFNLSVALAALERGDIGGTLTLRMPTKKNRSVEVEWHSQ